MADPGAYTQVNWQNKAAGGTKLGATNLNKVEDGLAALYNFSAKGSLWVASAAATVAELTVGDDDEVLVADATADEGVKWAKITNDNVDDSAAIAYSKLNLTGALVNADAGFTFGDWTPVLSASTPPTLGTGAVQLGRYVQLGELVAGYAVIQFGTSGENAGSGTYTISRPVDSASSRNFSFGSGYLLDSGASAFRPFVSILNNASTDTMRLTTDGSAVSNSAPWTWAANDRIVWHFVYEVA